MKKHVPVLSVWSGILIATVALPALAGSGMLDTGAPGTATPGQSNAFGVRATLVVDGTGTTFGPVAYVAGSTGAYDNKTQVAHESDAVALYPANPTPTLFLDGHDLTSEVKSGGIGVDSTSTEAAAHLASLGLNLNLNPPPPSSTLPVPQPLLSVTGQGIASKAGVTETFPGPVLGTGDANFASLTISGAVVGGAKLHFTGHMKPNTIIYSTSDVTITLNKQVKFGVVSCQQTVCIFKMTGTSTQAIDISLNKAKWYGHRVTGEIIIGQTSAQAE